ncbi:Gfo/Idh/MocA family protein [Alkaliflexus imshenetskii]|uniref:Gfo/Idh/MocA family protein n=1 Tax=Alkaliflexus imshenetskii TaxID=286730 RepID=UPI0004787177|nr:Gfo/Idh/MocA family oxidoreductase [Alkaliflexus imshenetskii]
MKKLKIGVLGVSNHFIKRIALPLQKTSNCHIYAIASRQRLKAESVADDFNIPLVCNNYEDLISHPDVDAIYNPLPNHLHAEWTIKALEQGKPVLCEKPLGMDEAEAKKMADVSNITGIPVMEAFMYKFHPMWQHTRNLIKTNQIGNISYIHTSFSYNNPSETNIRNNKDFGGGALMDIGCYAISVPRFLLDKEPLRVLAQSITHPDFGTDMHTSGLLDFGSARASFHVSTMSEPFQKVDIVGTAGSITIHIPFNSYVDVPSTITVNTGQGSRDVNFPVSDAYGLMFDAFAKALINGEKMPNPLSDAIGNMNVIDTIRKSAEIGSWVSISD